MNAPLLGHNLVRLLYLDEAGTDKDATFLSVCGVLIHGDLDWPKVDARILALIDKHIPEPDRFGFVFHATDIYHGSAYFDRRKPEWADERRRWAILSDLAAIINDLSLPVVAGTYRKDKFGIGILAPDEPHLAKAKLIQNVAAIDCLIWADRWLGKFAPSELATVIHEDGTSAKPLIKLSIRLVRNDAMLEAAG